MAKPSVLFVCVHNAGRSQMAAGYAVHAQIELEEGELLLFLEHRCVANLLQGDDVGPQLVDHMHDPESVAVPVAPDTAVDVVTGDPKRRRSDHG